MWSRQIGSCRAGRLQRLSLNSTLGYAYMLVVRIFTQCYTGYYHSKNTRGLNKSLLLLEKCGEDKLFLFRKFYNSLLRGSDDWKISPLGHLYVNPFDDKTLKWADGFGTGHFCLSMLIFFLAQVLQTCLSLLVSSLWGWFFMVGGGDHKCGVEWTHGQHFPALWTWASEKDGLGKLWWCLEFSSSFVFVWF